MSDFFKYGVVAFCQFLAFPRQWQGRRLWLVAACVAAPLWHVSESVVAVMILSLALAYITANAHFASTPAPSPNMREGRL
ncbi:MAG: hypothetical protein OXE95_05740 [Chloroflexi bacterium]|nr:hypothetical protein [Chloroflexota bacterium]